MVFLNGKRTVGLSGVSTAALEAANRHRNNSLDNDETFGIPTMKRMDEITDKKCSSYAGLLFIGVLLST